MEPQPGLCVANVQKYRRLATIDANMLAASAFVVHTASTTTMSLVAPLDIFSNDTGVPQLALLAPSDPSVSAAVAVPKTTGKFELAVFVVATEAENEPSGSLAHIGLPHRPHDLVQLTNPKDRVMHVPFTKFSSSVRGEGEEVFETVEDQGECAGIEGAYRVDSPHCRTACSKG